MKFINSDESSMAALANLGEQNFSYDNVKKDSKIMSANYMVVDPLTLSSCDGIHTTEIKTQISYHQQLMH